MVIATTIKIVAKHSAVMFIAKLVVEDVSCQTAHCGLHEPSSW